MLTQALDTNVDFAVALLIHYSFDLHGYTADKLVDYWLKEYPANWIRLAVIEALYRGRYKAISIEQILAFWQRRGLALYHFNHEFERLVCADIPQKVNGQPDTKANFSPLVPEEDGCLSNGYNDSAKELTQPCRQTNGNEQRVQRLCLPQALPKGNCILPRSHSSLSDHSIEQFTPETADGSDFYTKLKAISQSES